MIRRLPSPYILLAILMSTVQCGGSTSDARGKMLEDALSTSSVCIINKTFPPFYSSVAGNMLCHTLSTPGLASGGHTLMTVIITLPT